MWLRRFRPAGPALNLAHARKQRAANGREIFVLGLGLELGHNQPVVLDPYIASGHRRIERLEGDIELVFDPSNSRCRFARDGEASHEPRTLLQPLLFGDQPVFRCAIFEAVGDGGLAVTKRAFEQHQRRCSVAAKCDITVSLIDEERPCLAEWIDCALRQSPLPRCRHCTQRRNGLCEWVYRRQFQADRRSRVQQLAHSSASSRQFPPDTGYLCGRTVRAGRQERHQQGAHLVANDAIRSALIKGKRR